jgi:tetratricopeptide (TPR) repeat protein
MPFSPLVRLLVSAALLAASCLARDLAASWTEQMQAGDAAHKSRDYLRADKIYQAALKIAQQMGPADPQIATTLVTMYEEAGNRKQVEILHKLAIAFEEKARGKEHPAVTLRLCGLAQYYQNQSRFADAEPLLARAVLNGENTPGAKKPALAAALNQQAAVPRSLGRPADAARAEARAKAVR